MKPLASDLVYHHLKLRGLVLSPTAKVQVPEPTLPPQTLLNTITSYFKKKPGEESTSQELQIHPISNCGFIAFRKDTLHLYSYKIHEETRGLIVTEPSTIQLKNNIEGVFTSDDRYQLDRPQIPILVKTATQLILIVYDAKKGIAYEKTHLPFPLIKGVGVLNEKEVIVMDEQTNIVMVSIMQGSLKRRKTIQSPLSLNEGETIFKTWIISDIVEESESIVHVFYAVLKENSKVTLRVREYMRTQEGMIITVENSDYVVPAALSNHPRLNVNGVGNYFLVQMPMEVLVMKKKFDKYMIMDNMMEKIKNFKIFLNTRGIIASVGPKEIELNCVQLGDPKCSSRICDIIEYQNPELEANYENFQCIWPIFIKQEYSLVFVFMKDNAIILSHLMKRQPAEKIQNLVLKENRKELKVIEGLAYNLGISKKEFYLKLWKDSERRNADIYNYLLPCEDVPSIKKEMMNVMRKRKVQVSEILKILNKTSEILERKLVSELNLFNLKQFAKNDFLRRKIKMNSMDREIDHKIFLKIFDDSLQSVFEDIINKKLFPKEPIIDPMYIMVDQRPEFQLQSIADVFQEFKVLILEDYKNFLIKLLSNEVYKKNLLQIIEEYSFLLPSYPFKIEVQRPSKLNVPILKTSNRNNPQPLWFQEVTLLEWQSQMTKEKIMKMLHFDYQTSKLNESIDEFVSSRFGEEKMWKNGIISLSLEEFATKISSLNGINLYLDICQFANETSVANDGDPEISRKIIAILEKKNNLKGQELEDCILYTSMHYFLLKNEIGIHKDISPRTLRSLSSENLVALFFLQNKQRKEFIFRQFMSLYKDQEKFRDLLRKFIISDNCSRIELEILTTEIQAMGPQFQRKNQKIIEELVMGICAKLQIRENLLILETDITEDYQTHSLIEDIEMSKDLAFKIHRIKQIKSCREIFKNFKYGKMTYETLIDLEKDNQIFKNLLQQYFHEEYVNEYVELDGQKVYLNSPRNMLTLLVYLQEVIYYQVPPLDVMIVYGLSLIEWKQFELLSQIVNEENVLDTFSIDKGEYLANLIHKALEGIYVDQDIIFDDETRNQIINILSIEKEESPTKIREMAKLALASLFQNLTSVIHPSDIEFIYLDWKSGHKFSFIVDLIQKYIEKMNFQIFKSINQELEKAIQEVAEVDILNDEFSDFCLEYAKKLIEVNRFEESIQVLIFLRNNAGVNLGYALTSQIFLKSISNQYPTVEDGRKLLDFFIQNNTPQLDYKIIALFESKFNAETVEGWEPQKLIKMQKKTFYKHAMGECSITYDSVWEMSKQESKSTENIYYNYYFLSNGLVNPEIGFRKLRGISYNLERITNLFLNQLEMLIRENKQLWIIDYDDLLKKFVDGLLLDESIGRLGPEAKIGKNITVQNIINKLKEKKGNSDLIKCLLKIKQEVKSKFKREERKNRFEDLLNALINQQKSLIFDLPKEEPKVEAPVIPEVFLTWRKIEEEKRNITNRNMTNSQFFVSDRDILEEIFLGSGEFPEPRLQNNRSISQFILPFKDEGGDLVELLRNKNYEKAKTYPAAAVWEGIKELYREVPYVEISQMIEEMKIAEERNIEIARLISIFNEQNLPDSNIKEIFSADFFREQLPPSEAQIFQQLRPKIKEQFQARDVTLIKNIAKLMAHVFSSGEYSSRVYLEALIYVGENLEFISDSALFSLELLQGLGEYPEIVTLHFHQLLDSFKDAEMKNFVREALAKTMKKKGYEEVAEQIKAY